MHRDVFVVARLLQLLQAFDTRCITQESSSASGHYCKTLELRARVRAKFAERIETLIEHDTIVFKRRLKTGWSFERQNLKLVFLLW